MIRAEEEVSVSLNKLFESLEKQTKINTIEKDDNLLDSYYDLYNELVD